MPDKLFRTRRGAGPESIRIPQPEECREALWVDGLFETDKGLGAAVACEWDGPVRLVAFEPTGEAKPITIGLSPRRVGDATWDIANGLGYVVRRTPCLGLAKVGSSGVDDWPQTVAIAGRSVSMQETAQRLATWGGQRPRHSRLVDRRLS